LKELSMILLYLIIVITLVINELNKKNPHRKQRWNCL